MELNPRPAMVSAGEVVEGGPARAAVAHGRVERGRRRMKARGWAVIVVGGILATLGVYGGIDAFGMQNTSTTSIPVGAMYVSFEVNLHGTGSLHVDYAVVNGAIDVYALTEAQYAVYANNGTSEALHAELETAAGSFDVALPGSGRYFIAINHGDAFEGIVQVVRTTIRLTGIDPTGLAIGLIVLVAGIAVVAVGASWRRTAMRVRVPGGQMAPPTTPPPDVSFYEHRKPPEGPTPPSPPESPPKSPPKI